MKRGVQEEPPPFLGTWGRVYGVVIVYLATLITLFWFFGKAWS